MSIETNNFYDPVTSDMPHNGQCFVCRKFLSPLIDKEKIYTVYFADYNKGADDFNAMGDTSWGWAECCSEHGMAAQALSHLPIIEAYITLRKQFGNFPQPPPMDANFFHQFIHRLKVKFMK